MPPPLMPSGRDRPSAFGITPTRWARPVAPCLQAARAGREIASPNPARRPPRFPSTPQRPSADRPGAARRRWCRMVQQRREPAFLSLRATWRTHPAHWRGLTRLCVRTRFAGRVPLGPAPFLHRLRGRYPALSRLQVLRAGPISHDLHSRITLSVAGRPARPSAGRVIMGSPGSRAWRPPRMHRFSTGGVR